MKQAESEVRQRSSKGLEELWDPGQVTSPSGASTVKRKGWTKSVVLLNFSLRILYTHHSCRGHNKFLCLWVMMIGYPIRNEN